MKWDPCQLLSLPFCAQFCKVVAELALPLGVLLTCIINTTCIVDCQEICDGRLLAVGDEEGTVSVVNAAKPLSVTLSEARLAAQWQAHQNAVFDLEWLQVHISSLLKSQNLFSLSSSPLLSECSDAKSHFAS